MKRIEIIGDNYFGYWDRERIACRGIVIQDDKVLLSYETKTDTWMLPGGGLENGEDEKDCCRREVYEETGFIIGSLSCVLEIDEYYENCKYATKYFLASIKDRCETRLTGREKEAGMEPRWLPIDEAIDVFSTHASFADTDEMKRGLYQREYTALCELFRNTKGKKKPKDMIQDGVLAYGVTIGRFIFEEEQKTVYAISDFPHIGGSDVLMCYQISREDYDRLLPMSKPHGIPVPEVSSEITDACHREFLCGESAYCKRNEFSLEDTDLSLMNTNKEEQQ